VRVDAALRSVSHPNVFAAGDCAAFDPPRPKAGVWAVRAGPMLARNLRRAATALPLRPWRPSSFGLTIVGLGDSHAVAWRGRFVLGGLGLSGRVAWWWKNWLDRRWLRRYRIR
jgi:selenide,water dikinase